ncbi:MAG TPA: TetR family transcriptional regulator [Mycobacterium sp.]
MILDAALSVAASGGYEAVQMRAVAARVGIAVGTLYRYYPAKTHLLVAGLTREFRRLDSAFDWASVDGTPLERLERLTGHLHDRWQSNPSLTAAMTRAFAIADTSAAAELDRAAAEIQVLLARTLKGGEPTPTNLHVAGHLRHLVGQPRDLQRPPRVSCRYPRPYRPRDQACRNQRLYDQRGTLTILIVSQRYLQSLF